MKQHLNEIKRMQKLAGIIKENYDDDSSGYSYEYKEGPGANPQEIANTIKQYKKDKFTWEKLAKNDFYSMAQGKSADIKSEYYPEWKKEDFQTVIDALESSSLNEDKNDTGEELANFLNQNQAEVERKINRPDLHLDKFLPNGDYTKGTAVDDVFDPPFRGIILSFSKDAIDYDDIESIEVQGKTIYYSAFNN